MARITLVRGDITTIAVDAIVNAANDHLWMGAGVAGAIKRAGGEEIEREAVAKGPIAVGEAVVTGAGRLRAKHVIHAAVMGQDLRTDAEKIRRATASALRRAAELGLRSVALPALGTGVGGFPLGECARLMIGEVERHVRGEAGPAKEAAGPGKALPPGRSSAENEAAGPREALRPGRSSVEEVVFALRGGDAYDAFRDALGGESREVAW